MITNASPSSHCQNGASSEKPGFNTIDLKINYYLQGVVPSILLSLALPKDPACMGRRRGLILILFARVPRRYLVLEP